MSNSIGTTANPLRVAVFGSGPAGFYASEELLKQTQPIVSVDLFDRLPTPFGLVRGGVAPDHQKIKTVTRLFERTAGRPRFRFFGNVNFGQDIHLEEVLEQYHQVLFCTGAESDRQMGIPGEALAGSYPATAFVGWYNGHPDYRNLKFELGVESVAVVGIGNVAMDVARILTRPVEDLARTDIAAHALEALRASKVRTVYLLGRRGPAQAAFTNPEIRELGEIPGTDLVIRPEDMALDELSREFLSQQKDPVYQRNVEILTTQAEKGPGVQAKKIHLWFFTSPAEVLGASRVERLRLEKNTLVRDAKGRVQARGTGEFQDIAVQMLFRSIGYLGTGLPGLPFDERSGTIPNEGGRVTGRDGTVRERVYVAGWIKRGPSGVIGTNKPCAIGTVKSMLEDFAVRPLKPLTSGPEAIVQHLRNKKIRTVSFDDWRRLDEIEIKRGEALGKPREKFTRVEDMLQALA